MASARAIKAHSVVAILWQPTAGMGERCDCQSPPLLELGSLSSQGQLFHQAVCLFQAKYSLSNHIVCKLPSVWDSSKNHPL